jgi:hypothetical protein
MQQCCMGSSHADELQCVITNVVERSNGKLDRTALPLPEGVRPMLDGFVGPRTDIETTDAGDRFRLHGDDVLAVPSPARLRRALAEEAERYAPDWIVVSREDPSHNLCGGAASCSPTSAEQ